MGERDVSDISVDVMGQVGPSLSITSCTFVSNYLPLWRYEEEIAWKTTAENEFVKTAVSSVCCGIVAWESGKPQASVCSCSVNKLIFYSNR